MAQTSSTETDKYKHKPSTAAKSHGNLSSRRPSLAIMKNSKPSRRRRTHSCGQAQTVSPAEIHGDNPDIRAQDFLATRTPP